jgi:hypothetical protein
MPEEEQELFPADESEDSALEEPVQEVFFAPTDEPEEISAEEAIATDIPLEATPVEEAHLTSTVCDVCLELNLTTKTCICCARCGQAFCLHFASSVDAQYCVNCLSDISMSKSTITKTYKHKNDETGTTTFYRRKAREIKIDGLDWLFSQRKIVELSDMELDLSIEYHRNILSLMIAEQERKRTEYMHRYAGVKIHIPMPATTTVHDSTTTTVKKTRTVSKNKQQEQLAAMLKQMQAKGLGLNDIMKLIKK